MILLLVAFLLFVSGAITSYIARKEYNEWLYKLSARLMWIATSCTLIAIILLIFQ